MIRYTILSPHGMVTTAKTICHSKFLVVNIITLICLVWTIAVYVIPWTRKVEPERPMQPARSFVVPNIVHFIRYGPANLTFIDAVCILAALKQQKPLKVYVHTDQKDFVGGKYWKIVNSHRLGRGIVELKQLRLELGDLREALPDPLIVKLKILKTYGGIYLDNDCYLVNSVNKFRMHELTLGWVRHSVVPHNIIIASSEAKFLPIWIKEASKMEPSSFSRRNYDPFFLLKERPSLVNWMTEWMIDSREVTETVYFDLSNRWKYTNVIKLFTNQQYLIPKNLSHKVIYPVVFNETNILDYNISLKLMVKDAYPLDEK